MTFLYNRILLKLSGELCAGRQGCLDAHAIDEVAREIAAVTKSGIRVAAVLGGGNIMRGRRVKGDREDERAGHQAGMMATVVNGIMLARALARHGMKPRLFSAFEIPGFVGPDDPEEVERAVLSGSKSVLLFVGGTGVPFKSTDSATVMKAIAVGAQAIFKVTTHVDGVYDKDPQRFKGAKKYSTLAYDEALRRKLEVMDLAAFAQARDAHIPIHVFKWGKGRILRVLRGERVGSTVKG